jgi:hypothetical protein
MAAFTPNGLPLLIGSLPLDDHTRALDLVFDHTRTSRCGCNCRNSEKKG